MYISPFTRSHDVWKESGTIVGRITCKLVPAYLAKVGLTSINLIDGVGIYDAHDIRPNADCAPVLVMKFHHIHLMRASPGVDEAPEIGAFCSHGTRNLSQAWTE